MNESAETRDLCRRLEAECGAVTLPYAGSRYGRNGWPDRWVAHPLWCGWLEFKAQNGTVSKLQRETMRQIWLRRPGEVFLVWHGIGAVEQPDGWRTEWQGGAAKLLETLKMLRDRQQKV